MTEFTLDRVRELAQTRELSELARIVRTMPVNDIVDVLRSVPTPEAAIIFRLLEKNESIEVFESLDSGGQAELVSEFRDADIARVFGSLDPEEQAWLLDEIPAKVAKRIVTAFSGDELGVAMSLLGYAKESVGRRMSPQAVVCQANHTAGEVLRRVSGSGEGSEMLVEIPVITGHRKLVGVVELPKLIEAEPGALIQDLMDPDPRFAYTEDDAEQVSRRVLDFGDLVLPIVDREERLVGVFPIADAARIDREAVAEDQARAGASEPLRRPYLLTPVLTLTKSRIVWLLVLAVSATLTVHVLQIFEDALVEQVVLALFVPLLIGIGGNTGSQAATTVTRALAVGDVELRDIGRVALREVLTGLSLGAVLAAITFAIASFLYGVDIGLVLSLTLLVNLPLAATVGGVIPMVARACRVDPAVFSTPFISTFCDATGLLVYFMIASTVFGL